MGNTLPACAALAMVFTSLHLQLNPKLSSIYDFSKELHNQNSANNITERTKMHLKQL